MMCFINTGVIQTACVDALAVRQIVYNFHLCSSVPRDC